MLALATGVVVLVNVYATDFAVRPNRNSSSVVGDTCLCKDVTQTNMFLLLLINICANIVLGMSNTY